MWFSITHHQPLPWIFLHVVSHWESFLLCCCSAFERLLAALTHQLYEMEKVTLQHMKGTSLVIPEPLHFLLPQPKGLVTVVYPAGVSDSQLETQRKVRTTQILSNPKQTGKQHEVPLTFIVQTTNSKEMNEQAVDPTHCTWHTSWYLSKHCNFI